MPRRVAVVGGGCSGVLAASHLLRSATPPGEVLLFEATRRPLGHGIAYSTEEEVHLLNVSADDMSAVASEPHHFATWAARRATPESRFLPRRLYGEYLGATLSAAAAQSDGRLHEIRSRVVSLHRQDGSWRVGTNDAGEHMVDAVVLALGYQPATTPPPLRALRDSERYIDNAWEPGALRVVSSDDAVLIIGAGLTALDVALSLEQRGHRGRITLGSRHGLLPRPHPETRWPALPLLPAVAATATVSELSHTLRKAVAAGADPRAAVDALRQATAGLWRSLPPVERRRFLRHCARLWEVHRHRMAPEVAARLAALRRRGQLDVRRVRLVSAAVSGSSVQVRLHTAGEHGAAAASVLEVDRVVNCTAPSIDLRNAADPLLRSLVAAGLAVPDPLGLGMRTDSAGRMLDQSGAAAPGVRVIGPPRKGECWESTAVPEVRVQAAEIAAALTRDRS